MEKKLELIGEYNSNNERYCVYADVEGLCLLIDSIVENSGYKEEGNFCLTDTNSVDYALEKIKAANSSRRNIINGFISYYDFLPNHLPLYREITSWRTRDLGIGTAVDFQGKKIVSPKLAWIIYEMINQGTEESIKNFFGYESDEEIISIDDKIDKINKENSGVRSIDYDKETLKQLAQLYTAKATGHHFDSNLLKHYYCLARGMVELRELNLSEQENLAHNSGYAKIQKL